MGKKSIAEYNRTFQNVTDIIGKAVAVLPPVTSYTYPTTPGGGGGGGGGGSTFGLFKGSGRYTFNQTVDFLIDVLKGLGISSPNPYQIQFMKAWKQKEGSFATFNPFGTTLGRPGAKPFNTNNGFPVKNYIDRAQGLEATIATLKAPAYVNVVTSIKNITIESDIDKAMRAVNNSPWGSKFNPPDYRYWRTLNNFIATGPIVPN
jgi:hypothetical protein